MPTQLKKLIVIAEAATTPQEIRVVLQAVLTLLIKRGEATEKELEAIKESLADTTKFAELRTEVEQAIAQVKLKKGERGEQGERGEAGKDGRDGKDGKDGKDGLPGRDGRDGIDGRDGVDGKDGEPGTYIDLNAMWQKIEDLVNDRKFDELTDFRKEMEERISKIPRGRLGMKKITSVRTIDLTSQVDGATTSFTLPADTLKVLGVWGTQFPITFRNDVDWTFSGRTLSLVATQVGTPQSGQTLQVMVETAFYA